MYFNSFITICILFFVRKLGHNSLSIIYFILLWKLLLQITGFIQVSRQELHFTRLHLNTS